MIPGGGAVSARQGRLTGLRLTVPTRIASYRMGEAFRGSQGGVITGRQLSRGGETVLEVSPSAAVVPQVGRSGAGCLSPPEGLQLDRCARYRVEVRWHRAPDPVRPSPEQLNSTPFCAGHSSDRDFQIRSVVHCCQGAALLGAEVTTAGAPKGQATVQAA